MSSLEDLFGKLAMTTVTTVSRIALSHATNAAIRNVTTYITQQPKSKEKSSELESLQRQLDLKIKNLKPTLDIIARSVADGNTDLEPALEMCNDLKRDIDQFSTETTQGNPKPDYITLRLKQVLSNVDDMVPSLHLALRSFEATTGKQRVSSSKLIQASYCLEAAKPKSVLAKPVFCLKLYSLFAANARSAEKTAFTWKEEFHKSSLELHSHGSGTNCQLVIKEDLDDGLYHEELGEDQKKEKTLKGKTLVLDVDKIKRMYYTQSGELLNIEDAKTPVLVLKIIKTAEGQHEQIKAVEKKPEIGQEELQDADWYAFEIWSNDDKDDEDDDDEEEQEEKKTSKTSESRFQASLLLLESAIRLAMLEATEHIDHLAASDELIDLYMVFRFLYFEHNVKEE
ncbi:RanGTP-binding protein-domain-containing protein [Phycomyces nitens]|nr:RanGTP-binding protein-domain-containing protein [Phycomyces nitens]